MCAYYGTGITRNDRINVPKKLAWVVAIGFLVSLCSCGDQTQQPSAGDGGSAPEGILVSDAESSLRAELEQADRAFARRVRDTRLDGWVDGFAEDGMVLPADGPIATGPSAIRELFAPLFAEPGFEISWAPVGAEVASSGDFGYTFGDWRTSMPTAGAEVKEAEGKYVTVWRRDRDGRWRVLLDIGNTRQAAGKRD